MRACALSVCAVTLRLTFSRVAVPEFDSGAASATKGNAALLQAAEAHLGNLLAELYVAMPSLAECGFKASLAQHPPASLLMQTATRAGKKGQGLDPTSAAVAAIGPSMGVDMAALQGLVASAREALAQASR